MKVKSAVKAGQTYWCIYRYDWGQCQIQCYNEDDTLRWIPARTYGVLNEFCDNHGGQYFKREM